MEHFRFRSVASEPPGRARPHAEGRRAHVVMQCKGPARLPVIGIRPRGRWTHSGHQIFRPLDHRPSRPVVVAVRGIGCVVMVDPVAVHHKHFMDGSDDIPAATPALGQDHQVPGAPVVLLPVCIHQLALARQYVPHLRIGKVSDAETSGSAVPRPDGNFSFVVEEPTEALRVAPIRGLQGPPGHQVIHSEIVNGGRGEGHHGPLLDAVHCSLPHYPHVFVLLLLSDEFVAPLLVRDLPVMPQGGGDLRHLHSNDSVAPLLICVHNRRLQGGGGLQSLIHPACLVLLLFSDKSLPPLMLIFRCEY
mmetsp:Transcript_59550/g.98726  ORF Transcript_59550/g.98726 Transcript_59550/m.98726 type:complete len:304 (-) Transcript_59550:525-1436(-)